MVYSVSFYFYRIQDIINVKESIVMLLAAANNSTKAYDVYQNEAGFVLENHWA